MVKGISRQVIVVHAPDPQLFEQAIFILRDDAIARDGITDERLLKEAKRIVAGGIGDRKQKLKIAAPWWGCIGAVVTGVIWFLSTLF